jgi:methenyltetrahydromethanopterin cyclohydrolase
MGTAPLPPTGEERSAGDRPHERLRLYGGRPATRSTPTTRRWRAWPSGLPASASSDYGTPFYEIFKRYDSDFYKIDPMLFSPPKSG